MANLGGLTREALDEAIIAVNDKMILMMQATRQKM